MRLAFLGNAFEMQDCVWECLRSVVDDLNSTNVLSALDDVPEELRGHQAMARVTTEIVETLSRMLVVTSYPDSPFASERERRQKIVTALASALGPVNKLFDERLRKLFDESHSLNFRATSFYTCLPIKPHVLALSFPAMEDLLASDALQVTTENEVYTLVGSWIRHRKP